KTLLGFLLPLALCAAASAQMTAIGPFTGSDSETFESKPYGFHACLPGRVFNNKGDLCDPNGVINVTSGWSFACQIQPHGGTHFVGSAGQSAVYTFDNPVSKFGGYFGSNNGTPNAKVAFFDANGQHISSELAVIPADCNWYWNGWQANAGAVVKRVEIYGLSASGGGFIDMDDMQIEAGCGGGTVYCTAKVNSAGCTPSIGSTGSPSASAGSGFVVKTINVLDNKFGLYFYSKTGPNNAPFQGGFLCGQVPLVRTMVQNSGGTPPCNGSYTMDFNAYIASGKDPALVAGQDVWVQTWSRDPASASTTNLSDALSFTICP
ncbi:MAG TPA: hypothetical protein VMS76_18430, partial [Planctomycetota bacterium]|nr:hypothetical protein [Planctomycetota bacterium]